jgi:hypothetical protein
MPPSRQIYRLDHSRAMVLIAPSKTIAIIAIHNVVLSQGQLSSVPAAIEAAARVPWMPK